MCECVGSGVGVVKPYMADTAAVTMGDVAVPLIELKGVKYLTVTSSSTLPHGALPYHTSIHHFSSGITGWKIEATHTQKTARFCCKRTETNRKLTCRRARGRYTSLSCSLLFWWVHTFLLSLPHWYTRGTRGDGDRKSSRTGSGSRS